MRDRASEIRERVNIIEVIGDVVPLKRKGTTFFGCCPFHNENTPSMAVDEAKQLFHCHGCGVGGDVIRFVERHYNLEFKAALDFLSRDRGERKVDTFKRQPRLPVPEWAPGKAPRMAFDDEIGHGYTKVWLYRGADNAPLFYIRRKDTREGKQIVPLSWGTLNGVEGWHAKHYPTPRPLYNLPNVLLMNDREVVVVEGEKAADAAAKLLPGSVVTTWPGGTNAVDKTDWTPLRDRRALLWPDADKPGVEAMEAVAAILLGQGCTVRIARPLDMPKGWDAADALADGWDNGRTGEWLGTHTEALEPPPPEFDDLPADDEPLPPDEPWLDAVPAEGEIIRAMPEKGGRELVNEGREYPTWMSGLPALTSKGHPVGNEANAIFLAENDPAIQNRIQFDEFTKFVRIIGPMPWAKSAPIPRNWTDIDDIELCAHMQRHGVPVKLSHAASAARVVAMGNSIHPVRNYLLNLEWDGVPRLDKLLTEYVTPALDWTPEIERYRQAVGRKWMIQAVARIMRPGCQADMTLVIEGLQGIGKSSLFRALGGQWFSDDVPALGTKDATDHVTSAWIVELSELSAMRKSDVESVKAFLTRQVDRYRPPYGRTTIEVPRQAVFCATSNDAEWLEDRTGGRRFYPVTAADIDVNAVRRDRDQLWAEAVSYYESGEKWHVDEAEVVTVARDQQGDRMSTDPWLAQLRDMFFQKRLTMQECLQTVGVPPKDRTTAHTKRVARILLDAGYIRKRHAGERWYEKP